MIKKLAAVICTISMLAALLPCTLVGAAKDTAPDKTELLSALGLWNESITKYDGYVKALSGFVFDNPEDAGSAKEYAVYAGYVLPYEEYKGSATLTYADAVKYAVITLGYGDLVKAKGGTYADYITKANELKLLKGISAKVGDKAKKDVLAKLIYNMTKAEPMEKDFTSKETFYVVGDETSLLWLNRKIYRISGVLTATEHTSLYSAQGTDKADKIEIDEKLYRANENAYDGLLGNSVEAWVKVEKYEDEPQIIYLEKTENDSELEIAAADIKNVENDFSAINYYNDNGTAKKAKLKKSLRVIYNGVYYGSYTLSDLKPDIGRLNFVDNDGDGSYEVLKITSYKTIIVDSIDAEDGVINNRYSFSDALKKLEVDKDEDNLLIYKGGEQITLSSIKIGDVLSVAQSKGAGDKVINIYVSETEAFEGKVGALDNSEDIATVDGIEYKQSAEFKKYLSDKGKTLDLGKEYTFSIDYFGEIAYIKAATASDYVLVRKMYKTGFADEDVNVNYLDLNGEWHNALLASKVSLNGSSGKNPAAVYSACNPMLTSPEVFKLKTNAKGEVTSIETPVQDVVDEEKFTKTTQTDAIRYRGGQLKTFGYKYYLNDDAMVFVVPPDTQDQKSYRVMSAAGYFSSDQECTNLGVYDLNEYGLSSMFVYSGTKEITDYTLMLVTGMGETMADGSILPYIEGNRGVFEDINFIADDADTFGNIAVGDPICIHLDSLGKVDVAKKCTDLSDNYHKYNNAETNYYDIVDLFVDGSITAIDSEKQMIKIKHGDVNGIFRLSPTKSVMFFDRTKQKCTVKTAAEIKVGDEVFVRLSRGTISEMICYE